MKSVLPVVQFIAHFRQKKLILGSVWQKKILVSVIYLLPNTIHMYVKIFLPHRLFVIILRLSKAFLDICVAKFWRAAVYILDFAGTLFFIFNLCSFGLIFALGLISSTSFELLLCAQIPKAQKDTDDLTVFFALSGSDRGKCWWNWCLGSSQPYGQSGCALY